MKKLLLGLGTLATIAAPIAAVVSCGASAPLYKRDMTKVMSDKALEDIASTKGFIKVDLENNPDQLNDLQSNIDNDIHDAKTEQSSVDEEDKVGIENINIDTDLSNLKFNQETQYVYYNDDSTRKQIYSRSTSGYSNYISHEIEIHSMDYMIVDKKSNKIIVYPSKVYQTSTLNLYHFSDFDSSIGNLYFSQIAELDLLRTLNKNPSGMTEDENGNQEKSINKINEITKNVIYQSLDIWVAQSDSDQVAQTPSQTQDDLNKVNLDVSGDEDVIDVSSSQYSQTNKFIIVKWLPNKFQFDESIYDKDKDGHDAKGSYALSEVKSYNDRLRKVFKNKEDFNKKVEELFFKKFMSDNTLNALISKFSLKKIVKDEYEKYTLDQRISLENKWEHENVSHVQGGTTNSFNPYWGDGVDTFQSILSSHGIKTDINLYVNTDGSNDIQISGGAATSPEEDARGFKKAFDNGITSGTLNDISSLINLRRDHSNTLLLNEVLDSVLGIDTSFDINDIEKKTPSGDDNPQYLAYKKVERTLSSRDERVVAFKEGTDKYSFIKVERSSHDFKFDLDIYSNNEFDQKVKANKLNNILVSEFGNEEGFFKKLDSIFY